MPGNGMPVFKAAWFRVIPLVPPIPRTHNGDGISWDLGGVSPNSSFDTIIPLPESAASVPPGSTTT